MAYVENFFEIFFAQKDSLNRQFYQGDISKKEYIEQSYYFLKNLNKPVFKIVDNMYKAIYNYQYFNMSGKYFKMLAKNLEKQNKHPKETSKYYDMAELNYKLKDKTLIKILKLCDYQGIQSYYIRVKSDKLKHRLYEVVLKYEEILAIFHSTSPFIKEKLEMNDVFDKEYKKSLIDDYVNAKY